MKALITGANGGIGSAISQYLLTKNYFINELVHTRQADHHVELDLADCEAVSTFTEWCDQPYDVFIHAAGIREIQSAMHLSFSEWQRVMDINLTSAFLLSRRLLQLACAAQRPLNIIYISSISGLQGEPERAAYCAAKHGLIGLAKAQAIEFASKNVRVNMIAPGIIETNMTSQYLENPGIIAQIKNNIPLERWGQPHHIVQAVDFILNNDYMTGNTVVVDGGWTAGKKL